MPKNKICKAERQEDLAFIAESERIKHLIIRTLNKVDALLCFIHIKADLLSSLLQNFKKNSSEYRVVTELTEHLSKACGTKLQNIKFGIDSNRLVEELHTDSLKKLVCNFSSSKTEGSTFFVSNMEGLIQSFENRLGMNAENTSIHKKRLRRAWKEQHKYKEEIRGLRNELYGLQMATKARIAAKRRLIRQQEQQIVEIKKNCKEAIAKLCSESELHMEESCASSQDHQEELERELVGAKSTLEELISNHQQTEKNLRAEKREAEDSLQMVIALYDDTMFRLHAEVEGTQEGYLDELQQLQALQIKFEQQEVLYLAAMKEKQQEEREELERKVLLFRRRVAAYKIQNYWRAYQVRKQASKGKKGKKGRKKQTTNDKKK